MVVGQFSQDVDILVIGAGPSGYTAAFRAAELGKTVALVDPRDSLGGDCLHTACIPSKAVHFGLSPEDRSKLQEQLQSGLAQRCKSLGIERLTGNARFESSKSAQITGEVVSIVRFRKAIIASGSLPRTAGNDDTDKILQVEKVFQGWSPEGRAVIIGNTPSAIEAATTLKNHDVGLFADGPLLPSFNTELVKQIQRPLSKHIDILNECNDFASYSHIILAGHRTPAIAELNLASVDVKHDEDGINVNNSCQTSNPKIFAIGECAGCHHSAGFALLQGRVAAEVACGLDSEIDSTVVPQVVWSNPELAQCGDLESGLSTTIKWGHSGIAIALGQQSGLTKLTYDDETQAVLGIGIAGVGATELISEAVLAIEMGATLYDLASTVHPHPTKSELLSEVARVAIS